VLTFVQEKGEAEDYTAKTERKKKLGKPTEWPSCLSNQSQQASKHHSRNQPNFYVQTRPNQYSQQEKATPSSNAPYLPSLTTEQRTFSDPSDGFG
jgi:hypothetical protein